VTGVTAYGGDERYLTCGGRAGERREDGYSSYTEGKEKIRE
jgi:hypothetical protein